MSRITQKMPSASGVGAGQTATFPLPIGKTYHGLLLTYSGVTLAQMTELRLVVNGKVMQRITGGDKVDLFNKFFGWDAAAGVLRIPFDRPHMRLQAGEEYTAIGTGTANDPQQVTSMNLEIDIDAGAAAPALSLKAIQSEPLPFGQVRVIKEFTYAPSAAGEYQIVDLPKNALIGRIFLKTANLLDYKIQRDGFTLIERTVAENELIQNDGYRVAQAGWVIIDPTEEGFASETIPCVGAQDFRLILNMSGAESITTIVEYIGGLGT